MENEFINPFANSKVSLTSLEKALKSGTDGTENAEINRSSSTHRKSDVIVRGVLSVTVLSAEDLPAMDLMGKSDPFVVLHMKKTHIKNKTRVTFRPRSFILFFFLLSVSFLYVHVVHFFLSFLFQSNITIVVLSGCE